MISKLLLVDSLPAMSRSKCSVREEKHAGPHLSILLHAYNPDKCTQTYRHRTEMTSGTNWLEKRIAHSSWIFPRVCCFNEVCCWSYKWKLQTVVKRQLLTLCVQGNCTNGSVQKCSELLEKAVKCQNTKLGGANENDANEILFVDCFPWNKLQFLGISSVLEKQACVCVCLSVLGIHLWTLWTH